MATAISATCTFQDQAKDRAELRVLACVHSGHNTRPSRANKDNSQGRPASLRQLHQVLSVPRWRRRIRRRRTRPLHPGGKSERRLRTDLGISGRGVRSDLDRRCPVCGRRVVACRGRPRRREIPVGGAFVGPKALEHEDGGGLRAAPLGGRQAGHHDLQRRLHLRVLPRRRLSRRALRLCPAGGFLGRRGRAGHGVDGLRLGPTARSRCRRGFSPLAPARGGPAPAPAALPQPAGTTRRLSWRTEVQKRGRRQKKKGC